MGGAVVFACGGEPPPVQAPAGGSEAAPAAAPAREEETQSRPDAVPAPPPAPAAAAPARSDILEGEDELARAERDLAAADRELSGQAPAKGEAEQHDDAPGRGSAATKPKSSASQQEKPCATTCRAFASLVRARDSICRIDGSDGQRCTRATEIVERHTARSTSCGCG